MTAVSRTSGAMYSGVPQVLLLTDCMTSFLENPKSQSFSCGRGHGPCSSMLSSCSRGAKTPQQATPTLVSRAGVRCHVSQAASSAVSHAVMHQRHEQAWD